MRKINLGKPIHGGKNYIAKQLPDKFLTSETTVFQHLHSKFGNFREGFVFADAKFRENKPSRNVEITLSFTNVCKSCSNYNFFITQICHNAIRENKILAKISEFTVKTGL